jgi:hypothetical protein
MSWTPAQRLVLAGFLLSATSHLAAQTPESRPITPETPKPALKALEESVDAAKAKEAAGQLSEALAAYDAAVVKFGQHFDANGGTAEPPVIQLYKALIASSDALATKVETPEFEARIAPRDLLFPQEESLWGASKGAKWSRSEGAIVVEAVESGGRIMRVASVLPKRAEAWHDIVIDLEFTIDSGELDLYLRYWPDKKYYAIKFNEASGFEPAKRHRMTIGIKGSTITLAQPGKPLNSDTIAFVTSRTGGIGFGLNPGSKVTISKLTVKVLR